MDFIDVPIGERDFAMWDNSIFMREKVSSREEVVNLINSYDGIFNLGLSISTTIDSGEPLVMFLPFDFDAHNDEDALNEALQLYIFFKNLGFEEYLSFSGKKGYHVVVSLLPKRYSKRQLKDFSKFIQKRFRFKTLDKQLFGDYKRILRIPETINIKSGYRSIILFTNRGRLMNLDLFTVTKNSSFANYENGDKGDFILNHHYPCIEKLIKDRKYWIEHHPRHSFEPSQFIRFAFVTLRMWQGYSKSSVIREIESFGWDDYDRDITEYQVNHIYDKHYIMPSCSRIKAEGYCLDECPYAIKKNKILERLRRW